MLTPEIRSLMAQELATVYEKGCGESVLLVALVLRDGDSRAFTQAIELLMTHHPPRHEGVSPADICVAVAMVFAHYVYWVEGDAPLGTLMGALEHLGVPPRFRWPGAADTLMG